VVPGRPLSLVTVAKFNISARGKCSTGRTQQLFPGCVNIGSLAASTMGISFQMKQSKILIVILLFSQFSFGQDPHLFDKKIYKLNLRSQGVKALIEKQTEFKFEKHPLEWAQLQLDINLLRTDTLLDNENNNRTVYYFNRTGSLFLIMTTSAELRNLSKKVSVFDDTGNLILRESYSDSGSLVFRKRRGFFESNIQFECNYYDTPLYRLNVFSRNGRILKPKIDVCECNF
jgi:hypothetical protein